jgi:hypothetical protein
MVRSSATGERFAWVLLAALSSCALPHAAVPTDAARRDRDPLDVPDAQTSRDDASPEGAVSDGGTVENPPDAVVTDACPPDRVTCGSACVDTRTDPRHCGGCGVNCELPRASAQCQSGQCAIARCDTGFGDCDRIAANGCETPLDTVTDCGVCGAACSVPSGTAVCVSGACGFGSCLPGYANCDANTVNGCETAIGTERNCTRCGEVCAGATPVCDVARRACTNGCIAGAVVCGGSCVDTMTNAMHCGACGRRCAFPNAIADCGAGACRLRECLPGFQDCDRNPMNGCEVDVRSSVMNCGACGTACSFANASARCVAGGCAINTCNAGFLDCDGLQSNGCEVDVRSSVDHCGACRNRCAPENATPRCAGSACGYSMCTPGFLDCDGVQSNGCEVDGRASMTHCGACNAVCVRANAIATCAASRCTIGGCNPGYGDCDGNPVNGCEASFGTNPAHCGGCGAACPARANATAVCSSGSCAFLCAPNFQDCDGSALTGCETDLRSPSSCGACGRACVLASATSACVGGSCTIAMCATGFGDCDRVTSNGCEAPLNTGENCRACGVRCRADQLCGPAGCVCPTGQTTCGGRCVNTQFDDGHCGRCGNACPASGMCVAGACQCPGATLCTPMMGPSVCCPSGCTPLGTCM